MNNNKLVLLVGILLVFIIVVFFYYNNREDKNITIEHQVPTNEVIDLFGEKLRDFGYKNCKLVKINNLEVYMYGPSLGGCSDPIYNDETYVAHWGRGIKSRLSEFRANLKNILTYNKCGESELNKLLSFEVDITLDKFKENFSCLGEIEITDAPYE